MDLILCYYRCVYSYELHLPFACTNGCPPFSFTVRRRNMVRHYNSWFLQNNKVTIILLYAVPSIILKYVYFVYSVFSYFHDVDVVGCLLTFRPYYYCYQRWHVITWPLLLDKQPKRREVENNVPEYHVKLLYVNVDLDYYDWRLSHVIM